MDFTLPSLTCSPARLKENWHSPVYQFFQSDVTAGYDNGRKYHFFKCATTRCRNKGIHGVRRYQDSKDCGATSNLKSHAIRCFGKDVVAAAFGEGQTGKQDGSIFVAFARQGQAPVKVTHRAHTTEETRYVRSLFHTCSDPMVISTGLTSCAGAQKATAPSI